MILIINSFSIFSLPGRISEGTADRFVCGEAAAGGRKTSLDVLERSFAIGATLTKTMLKVFGDSKPPPYCQGRGKLLKHQNQKIRTMTTRIGDIELKRSYYCCDEGDSDHFPMDRALGIEGRSVTPAASRIIAETMPDTNFVDSIGKPVSAVGLFKAP